MKVGQCVYARTHADFLNQVLGTKYKAWMKSSISLHDGRLLWMVELGPFVTSSGWINTLAKDQIRERHIGRDFSFEAHNTYKGALAANKAWSSTDRVVFDIVKFGSMRKYVFRGVFRLNKEESTIEENVWDLVMDEYYVLL